MECEGSAKQDEINKTEDAINSKIDQDKFPVWVIVLLVLFFSGFFVVPVVGIILALTIPPLFNSTESLKSQAVLKKVYTQFNQSIEIEHALENEYYSAFKDVSEKAVFEHMNLEKLKVNKWKLADGAEFEIVKVSEKCMKSPKSQKYNEQTSCAKIIIDVNGFEKGTNKFSDSLSKINDRFLLLLYSDKVVPVSGSIEDKILKNMTEK